MLASQYCAEALSSIGIELTRPSRNRRYWYSKGNPSLISEDSPQAFVTRSTGSYRLKQGEPNRKQPRIDAWRIKVPRTLNS